MDGVATTIEPSVAAAQYTDRIAAFVNVLFGDVMTVAVGEGRHVTVSAHEDGSGCGIPVDGGGIYP